MFADAQTAGRGRRGSTWFSPTGAGLYVSTILAPARASDSGRARMITTLAAGVAIVEGIAVATGLRADLKWPNDLFVARRKLAGVLAEGVADVVVLGYGINVGPAAYPPELSARVTSLESELGRPVDRPRVFVETLAALSARYDDLLAGRFDAILDAWRAMAPACHGARVSWTTPAGAADGRDMRHRRPGRAAGQNRESDRAHRGGRVDLAIDVASGLQPDVRLKADTT